MDTPIKKNPRPISITKEWHGDGSGMQGAGHYTIRMSGVRDPIHWCVSPADADFFVARLKAAIITDGGVLA